MTFNESIKVEGNIRCKNNRFNLKVARNIDAWNIDARNIDAWNIDAGDINAGNIDAGDINAGNIDAGDINARNIIFCETVKLKDKAKGKIRAKAVIRKRFELFQKEWKSD